jgi:small subunit ribosomal protein S17
VSDAQAPERTLRKQRDGIVTGTRMDKTVIVRINRRVRHTLYGKETVRTKKLYVHDEKNEAAVGDTVRIMETRPLSKLKRWRLVEILRKAAG